MISRDVFYDWVEARGYKASNGKVCVRLDANGGTWWFDLSPCGKFVEDRPKLMWAVLKRLQKACENKATMAEVRLTDSPLWFFRNVRAWEVTPDMILKADIALAVLEAREVEKS